MSPLAPPRRIGFVAFDGVAAIDLAGVIDAFYLADGANWNQPPTRYERVVVAPERKVMRSEAGLLLSAEMTLAEAPEFDTIIVPGGPGLREPRTNRAIAAWLLARAPTTRRMVSVCSGLYAFAPTGLMDGRRCTTHWYHAKRLARQYPQLALDADALFIKDGPFYSSAGMTAGIDLALALIEEDHGPKLALAVAQAMVMYMKRSGGQMQYSETLRFQARAGTAFAQLAGRIVDDLCHSWTLETMAAEACLSPRQLTRRFKAAFGVSPSSYVEQLRLDAARHQLLSSKASVGHIAASIGFASDDAFRRAFERRFGVAPSTYRARFSCTSLTASAPS